MIYNFDAISMFAVKRFVFEGIFISYVFCLGKLENEIFWQISALRFIDIFEEISHLEKLRYRNKLNGNVSHSLRHLENSPDESRYFIGHNPLGPLRKMRRLKILKKFRDNVWSDGFFYFFIICRVFSIPIDGTIDYNPLNIG